VFPHQLVVADSLPFFHLATCFGEGGAFLFRLRLVIERDIAQIQRQRIGSGVERFENA
jgi:hypothetical protein